ncbi:Formiminotransferase subdomain-containing protein [Pavlovales sp. CCMP2436]|nr:Formiminotransferase subdomain-containing protein [Pavlovales sp. CCMP2436]
MQQLKALERIAAIVYVSTAAPGLLRRLKQLAMSGTPGARLLTVFTDEPYARTSLLIAGEPSAVAAATVSVALLAAAELDQREHVATHPCIGVVDHISLSPVDGDDLAPAAAAALDVGASLAHTVPVYLYGAAHPAGRTLATTRRLTPYFKAAAGWTAAPELPADFAPAEPSARTGACCVGATPLVLNYNLLLDTTDAAAARAVADAVRSRSGGPPGVEALALQHDGGRYEVACNLLDPAGLSAPAAVRAVADAAAAAVGTCVISDYTIGLTLAEIRERLAEAEAAGR